MSVKRSSIVSLVPDHDTLPHSIEAEQALLGTLMLNNDLFDEVEPFISPQQFYVPFHEKIYETIRHLLRKGFEASPLTLRDSLREREIFEKDGDLIDHLSILAENASLSSDVKALATIIANHHRQRSMIALAQELIRTASGTLTPEDTDQALKEAETSLYQIAEVGSHDVEVSNWEGALQEVINDIYEAHDDGRELVGVTSGLSGVDKSIGGFEKTDLIILAGRPSMGKTALALNLAFNAAEAKKTNKEGGAGVGIFSLEMSKGHLMQRFVSGASKLDGNRMRRGQLRPAELDKLQRVTKTLDNLPIYIDDTAGLDIDVMRSRARRMARKHNIGMIVVDYLQLMQSQRVARNGRVQEISEISRGLKAMAKELNVPVIALSQLSRANETRGANKRPQLPDLRDSGAIEQDADIVMFIHREEYYLQNQFGAKENWTAEQQAQIKKHKGAAELIVAKNRNGATGNIGLRFDAEATKFSSTY